MLRSHLLPWLCIALLSACGAAPAAPLVPASDDAVIETLPTLGALAREQRLQRRELAGRPRDAATALALSRGMLERAHVDGDARLAGQALGALRAWDGDAQAPAEIRLQRANVLQYLHEFEAAAVELEALLRTAPRQAQALLTLATVRRVQGRYADSDAACARLAGAGQPLYAEACSAENAGLRGRLDEARRRLEALAAAPGQRPAWAGWIRTTLGELELRAGRRETAIAQFQAALRLDDDAYARLALADALIEARRWRAARAALEPAGNADAVLLRRAIVARALGDTEAEALHSQLAERHAQAILRPEATAVHARERALFALEIEGDAVRAVALARSNLATQREAIDVVILDRAARAARDAAARAEASALAERIGLHDARLGAAS